MTSNHQVSLAHDGLIWRISESIWALQDNERHFGHIVKTAGRWQGYDATHLNFQNDGIRDLGYFPDIEAAKAAVEASVASHNERQSLRIACELAEGVSQSGETTLSIN